MSLVAEDNPQIAVSCVQTYCITADDSIAGCVTLRRSIALLVMFEVGAKARDAIWIKSTSVSIIT
jgi:hypothetical protein